MTSEQLAQLFAQYRSARYMSDAALNKLEEHLRDQGTEKKLTPDLLQALDDAEHRRRELIDALRMACLQEIGHRISGR